MISCTKRFSTITGTISIVSIIASQWSNAQPVEKPNIIIIYADDLGYGDVGCYGATNIRTTNIDRLAKQGLRFTNAHCTSATSTPSQYSLLTGEYAWRKKGTGVLPGDAVEKLGTHKTAGPLRGGKYSAFDGGTRVAFVVKWTNRIKPGISNALISQVDFLSSIAALTGQKLDEADGPDSFNQMKALLGKDKKGREWVVEHASNNRLSIIKGDWKFIEPCPGVKLQVNTNTETGNDAQPQLYNLRNDIGEKNNVAEQNPSIVKELTELLQNIRNNERTRLLN